MTARERLPHTGRNNLAPSSSLNDLNKGSSRKLALINKNLSDRRTGRELVDAPPFGSSGAVDIETIQKIHHERSEARKLDSSRTTTSSTVNQSARARLNDPLNIFRPYTPEEHIPYQQMPLILPKCRFATLRHIKDEPALHLKRDKLTCPREFIETLQAPEWFDTADQATCVDEHAKRSHSRVFVQRNKERLWKFDLEYLGKSPQEVCEEITHDENFLGLMKDLHVRERTLNLNSSDHFVKAWKDDHLQSLGEVTTDNMRMTLNTQREDRNEKVRRLFLSDKHTFDGSYHRGHNHAPDYGNFSKFNAFLKNYGGGGK